MGQTSYRDKLRDQRWQKRRLEIFSKSDFSCDICGDKDSTLNAHHIEYLTGRDPWEYSDLYLMCLCDACHNLCHFTGTKTDLKNHLMERHSFGSIYPHGVDFLFMIHSLQGE